MQLEPNMQTLLEYADRVPPAHPTTTGGEIYARFEDEPETFAVAVVDDDGRPVGLIDRNAFFLRMGAEFGRALYANRPATYVMEPPRIQSAEASVMDYLAAAVSGDRASLVEGFIVVDADGRYLAIGTALSLIAAGYRATKARIHELATKSAKLARAERKALAASRAKSQFLAIMSHEIRTPLNGVLAVAEIVDQKLRQPELRPYVRTIIDSGQTLHRLLTDALDLSRAESGAMDITPEPACLADLLGDLELLWRPLAEQKGLKLSLIVAGAPAPSVLVDRVRLKQILNNLVGNALKFTAKGCVEVRVSQAASGGACALAIEIEDSGPGIAPDQLERIFEPFAKADEHGGGAGLGLSICRQIVKAMGGELTARSTPGQGSVFRLTLSLPTCAPPIGKDEPIKAQIEPSAARVLVVDDNATNRLVACTFLEMVGIEFATARDGVEAVELAGCEAFDAILMDVKMPRMDGVEASRVIRALPGPNQRSPIIAVTANADPGDAAAYLAAGMSGVVQKPLTAESLLGAIATAFQPADQIAA